MKIHRGKLLNDKGEILAKVIDADKLSAELEGPKPEVLDDRFDIRLSSSLKKGFLKYCQRADLQPQTFTRDMLRAATEGRLSIDVPEEIKTNRESVYK